MAMSTEADLLRFFTEGTEASKKDLSLDAFEKDIGDIELDRPFFQFPDDFSIFPGTVPVIAAPSSLTYSTESDSPSQYSYGFAPSDYSSPSDVVTPGPVEQDVYATNDSVCSDGFFHDPSSFGPLPPSPSLYPVGAHSDYGTSLPHQFFEISLEELSVALQQSTTISSPEPLPTLVSPDTQTDNTSAKPFKCPVCPFASKRKYNLKTHIGTHDKEKSKRFRCATCHRRFSRKHDLQRHLPLHNVHGNLKSSPLAYSGSAVDSGFTTSTIEDIMAFFQIE